MQPDSSKDLPRHERLVRHPIHVTVEEAAHLREVADEGESPATPAIVVAAVLLFVVPLAAVLMLLVFGVAHFA